ncbi:MAG TPA: DNA polymerase Y family protein [Stellaceae bacterium]|nr:DNA polymerase Y family protein [Stellaceae bacterium]
MRRVMSLWLPRWSIDRRGSDKSPTDRPFALAASIGNQRLVTAVNAAAEGLGIVPGLPLTDARALHPSLAVAAADPVGDRAALLRLARWCGRYSPWVAVDGADGLWLDVTGCAHLHDGEESLVHDVIARLAAQGIAGRAAIAETAGAAWALARFGSRAAIVVLSGDVAQAIKNLKINGLRFDNEVSSELDRLGLREIGDLLRLPRVALVARFGNRVAERLDQLLGQVAEPLSPLPPSPLRWTRRRFAEPILTPEAIAAATEALLLALCRRLGGEQMGARRLVLTLYRVDGETAEVAVGTARPSRDPRHLMRLLAEGLGEVDPGLGIEDMILAATAVERLVPAQLGLKRLTGPAARQLARSILEAEGIGRDGTGAAELAVLVDRLASRLGPEAIGCLAPRQSHVPERAQRFAPVFAAGTDAPWPAARRPIRLLSRPEPIEAVAPVPDDPPILFRWRRLAHRVRRADGPERIAGEWWRGGERDAVRDYYGVEDEEGRRFWLFRAGLYRPEIPARWFLHGLFA